MLVNQLGTHIVLDKEILEVVLSINLFTTLYC